MVLIWRKLSANVLQLVPLGCHAIAVLAASIGAVVVASFRVPPQLLGVTAGAAYTFRGLARTYILGSRFIVLLYNGLRLP